MAEYLRRSRSFSVGPADVRIYFGQEARVVRCTLTVVQVTSRHRREWARTVQRHVLRATAITTAGPHPDSGKPRTVTYSVSGLDGELDLAIRHLERLDLLAELTFGEGGRVIAGAGAGPKWRPAGDQPIYTRETRERVERRI